MPLTDFSNGIPDGHGPQGDNLAPFPHSWEDFTEPFDATIFDGLELAEDDSVTSEIHAASTQTHPSDGRQTSTSSVDSRQQSLRPFSGESQYLDSSLLRRSQVPPDTGHLNWHVVEDLIDPNGHMEVSGIQLLRAGPHTTNRAVPIFMLREYPLLQINGSASRASVTWSDLETLLSEKQQTELVSLFFRFIQPAFPILQHRVEADSDHQNNFSPSATSLALLACIYATALPFAIHNDYLNATLTDTSGKREQLYSMAVASILEEANSPSIDVLQACLLLLQRGPTSVHQGLTPAYSWFSSVAATMAKALGLQYDCSEWNITPTEKRIRHRLWWATFIMDIWISVDNPGGRSIGPQDYDVPLPQATDEKEENVHFDCLVKLTHLLSQIHETYYTIRAAKDTACDLYKSLEYAKPLRSALNECKLKIKSEIPVNTIGEPGTSGCVHLASCVASIVLFRALLRPIQLEDSATTVNGDIHRPAAAAAIMTGSINCAREAVELLEHMVSMVGPWSEFWHSWSQGNFAIISTFLVQLMRMSSNEDSTRADTAELISRWKRAIRVGAGSGGWGSSLMGMALSRLDSLLSHLST